MFRTIRSKKCNRITKPIALISIVSLLICTSAQPVLSGMQMQGSNFFSNKHFSIISLKDPAQLLNDEGTIIKNVIETKFSDTTAIDYKFAFKISAKNTETFIVPIIGRGLFKVVLRDGRQTSFFFPLKNAAALLSISKGDFNFLSPPKAEDPWDHPPDSGGGGGGGGDSNDFYLSILVSVFFLICIVSFLFYLVSNKPDAAIVAPSDDSHYVKDACIDFQVAVGNLDFAPNYGRPCECTWTSDIDGKLGSVSVSSNSPSASFQRCDLSPGEHFIGVKCDYNYRISQITIRVSGMDNININIQ